MPFRGGRTFGVEISAGWTRNLYFVPGRLSETPSAGSGGSRRPRLTRWFFHKPVEPAVNRRRARSSKAQCKKAREIEQVGFISRLAEVSPGGARQLPPPSRPFVRSSTPHCLRQNCFTWLSRRVHHARRLASRCSRPTSSSRRTAPRSQVAHTLMTPRPCSTRKA